MPYTNNRRPYSHIHKMREVAYKNSIAIKRRLLKATDSLGPELAKSLKDRRLHAYITALLEYQSNYDALVILDWYVGEGMEDARYKKYFGDISDELFEPYNAVQSDDVKSAVLKIDTLRRDERYDLYNLVGRRYTEDVIDHLMRRFWKNLDASRSNMEDDLFMLYVDLNNAIEALPEPEKRVAHLVCEGWTMKDIQREHHIMQATKLYNSAKRLLAQALGENDGKTSQEEES